MPTRPRTTRSSLFEDTDAMAKQGHSTMLTRRRFAQLSGMTAGSVLLDAASGVAAAPDVALEIAPYTLEASPKDHFRTVA